MNAYKVNLINSFSLIFISIWGYIDTVYQPTALIPLIFGLLLLLMSSGVKKENKLIAHLAVLLTLIILIALVGMRLPKSLDQGGVGLARVLIMIITSALSMVYFIKSFITNRKSKE